MASADAVDDMTSQHDPADDENVVPKQDDEQEEEMHDLFGEDEDVNMVEHEDQEREYVRLALSPLLWLSLIWSYRILGGLPLPSPLNTQNMTTACLLRRGATEQRWNMPKKTNRSSRSWSSDSKRTSPSPTSPSRRARMAQ
ncbi:hypothetical protein NUW54_g9923 [Trametes sanguinea]|uniref:Uncharacterized protein n=1 Tax=Trametes sanguinea TaxID=158606 RepID=A0ACC1P472_9APHY|nr:hypothetical protein NUW54_g9923 [Trametes sanguinea]